jgi:hypothetical protein
VITDRLLAGIIKTGVFNQFIWAKWLALLFLVISLLGARGRKQENITIQSILSLLVIGSSLFFSSAWLFKWIQQPAWLTASYTFTCSLGYILILAGGTRAARFV